MKCFYILSYIMGLNPKVWLPHLWFILYTIAIEYPKNPNDFTKKKILYINSEFAYLFTFKTHRKLFYKITG